MGVRAWIRKRFPWLSRLSSRPSTNQSNTVSLADAQTNQINQETPNANVLPGINDSPVDQFKTNEVIEQLDAQVQATSSTLDNTPIRELWNLAYDKLREEDSALIAEYEAKLQGSVVAGLGETVKLISNIRERMLAILQSKMDDVNKNTAKLKLGSSEVKIRDAAQLVLNVVGSANSYISQAVSLNQYASIAWAGVSFLLPLFMNISTQSASLAKGLEYVSSLIAQSQIREELYIKCYESRTGHYEEFQQSHRTYKAALERLYRQILRFQAKSCCYYSNNSAFRHGLDAVKWNDWDQLVNDVREQNAQFTAIERTWQNIQRLEERLASENLQQITMNSLSAIETDLAASRKAAESATTQHEREELLNWLCDIDPSSNYNTAREMHEVGTNEWLVKDSEEFRTWETNDRSLLWLHGKAGSGKSVLSSSVINYLKEKYASQPSTALAYFYFTFSDAKKQEVSGMLASLIKQICSRRSNASQLIERLKDYKIKGERPDIKTLEAELMASMLELSAIYIIIDGLDECPVLGRKRENLLKSVQNILLNAPKNLHVFLTSRKEQDIDLKIRTLLSTPSRTSIDLLTHREVLNNDIRHYIDLKLATDDFNSWPRNRKEKVRQSLIEKADCMFQYIRLQLETLQKFSSEIEINKALQDLPIGLDAAYNRILKSIDAKFQTKVTNSLKWLAFSEGVLSVENLSEIFIIDPDNDVAFDEQERLFSSTDALKYFSGLIVTQTSIRFPEVRLVHFSVKEYLTSSRIRESSIEAFSFTEVDAHMHIVSSCLAYLTYLSTRGSLHIPVFLRQFFKSPYPLARYASLNWGIHLEKTPRASWPIKVVQGVALMLADRSQTLLTLLSLIEWAGPQWPNYIPTKPHCYTAQCGFRQLTEMLVSRKHGVKYMTQEDLDFGLQHAVFGRDTDTVHFFLDKGAKIDVRCGNWNSALCVAVKDGNINILEILLNHGADINFHPCLVISIRSQDYRTRQIVKFLLEKGANIDMQDEDHGTALHTAIEKCDRYHFDLLLERGADVNALSEKLGTPLHAACTLIRWKADTSLYFIEELFDRRADPNIRGGKYATALQAACYTGLRDQRSIGLGMEIVQLLIEHGADVSIQGGEHGSALHSVAASPCPDEAIQVMKLLLDHGAKVDQPGGDQWGTALQVACHEGTVEVVQFLLDHGADVNAEGGSQFSTALQAAAYRFSGSSPKDQQIKQQILEMLIDNGAKVNQQSGECGTALQTACLCGDDALVYLLLKNGADVNARGGKDGTALMVACSHIESWVEGVRLLLDRGADINAQTKEHGTALLVACQSDNFTMELVQLLLDRGADINAQGGKYGTALSTACRKGNSELARLLLARGADVHLQDYAAWHSAARFNAYSNDDNADVLQLLLNQDGIDVNHMHEEYGTALHTMMSMDSDGALKDETVMQKWRKGVDVLLKHGIDANVMSERLGSALHLACATKHDNTHKYFQDSCLGCTDANFKSSKTKYLLEQCPGINVNAHGGVFGSALQAAAYSGQTLSVRLLLDREADVNARSGKYRGALNGAVISGYWDIVEILLEAGATPDCHLQEQPDEEWLQTVFEEHDRGAVERYRKFWEVEMENKVEGI